MIDDAFATDLLRNNKAVLQDLHTAVVKAVEDEIGESKADPTIPRATGRSFELESFAKDLTYRIMEADTVFKSFDTHVQRHINQTLDDWSNDQFGETRRQAS